MTTRITTGLLTTKEFNLAFRAAFRKLAREKKLTAELMALYAMVTGKPMGAVFSPVTNETKLANGQSAWDVAQDNAWRALKYPSAEAQALLMAAGLSNPEGLASLQAARAAVTATLLDQQYAARLLKVEA